MAAGKGKVAPRKKSAGSPASEAGNVIETHDSPATFEYYFTLQHNGRARVRTPFHCLISISAVAALCILAIGPKSAKGQAPAESVASSPAQIRALKITVLSTMLVGDTAGLGEWGSPRWWKPMVTAFCWTQVPSRDGPAECA